MSENLNKKFDIIVDTYSTELKRLALGYWAVYVPIMGIISGIGRNR